MKAARAILNGVLTLLYALLCCGWAYLPSVAVGWLAAGALLLLNGLFGVPYDAVAGRRLGVERHGTASLKAFLAATALSVGYHVWLCFRLLPAGKTRLLVLSAVWCAGWLAMLFWNGIISVYCTSVQLGIRTRLLGAAFGLVPVVHLVILCHILWKCDRELAFETEKCRLNRARRDDRICGTRYPVLLVHGVFFRDSKHLNYWGRIPAELERNGCRVYYGEHQSAASVADSAAELQRRVEAIRRETGCDKVNIIAHSKGGLDCRYALCHGMAPYVASLTTVNTPHRGCGFVDHLLERVPARAQRRLAAAYNAAAARLGDRAPDFMAAVGDLTAASCAAFDHGLPAPPSVYCQSVGSVLERAVGGRFPLNIARPFVHRFDGPNDGLVAVDSFRFGENFICLQPRYQRGISHGDVIDLNRENIPGFDVREFYVQLVADLKKRGF